MGNRMPLKFVSCGNLRRSFVRIRLKYYKCAKKTGIVLQFFMKYDTIYLYNDLYIIGIPGGIKCGLSEEKNGEHS